MSDDDGSAGASDIESAGLNVSDKELSDVESVVKTPNEGEDDDSSDDEPLSVLKQDVKMRLRSQNREEEDELALAESNSEDESRRDDFVRDYSREGDLEMLPMPRVTFPFPSYIRQVACKLDPLRHPLAAAPLQFLASQNLQLVLSRHAPVPSANVVSLPSSEVSRKRMALKHPSQHDTASDTSKRFKLPPSPTPSSHSNNDNTSSDEEGSKLSLEARS